MGCGSLCIVLASRTRFFSPKGKMGLLNCLKVIWLLDLDCIHCMPYALSLPTQYHGRKTRYLHDVVF